LKRRGVIPSEILDNWRPQNLFLMHIWGLERKGVVPNKISKTKDLKKMISNGHSRTWKKGCNPKQDFKQLKTSNFIS